ncbi:MAG: DUF2892 domain-containing protein [Candidatus Marinimicrobia bacterium]|jgi:hypothetical protein|nr:DUF2892 domain-containing protein [Candidatus Neomarinimicrobiota bacterium]MBT4359552.1 DUF2892 domain-containing protein [Candidatus Neomarinimicrobiota bacterium]MBT4714194.1 DUF2892 domain-containing protein [Candidatus Neomarinimicrobiota bacterium]MBT4945550.1 DUF2892 domain-containing protein [Candidatus Neomarinimicrobiota bacterium]MBT5314166.1 DUF2892 domain-containing protein [Candidatus Neomarinimicrobiota bacterium]
MPTNMGSIDRAIRATLAVLIGVLYFMDQISGTAAIVLGAVAVIFLLTSFMSFCPLYWPLKLSTAKKEESSSQT